MRDDGGLAGGAAGNEACKGDGADRDEEERWEMESEAAKEVTRTSSAKGALGLSARRNGEQCFGVLSWY